MFSISSSYQGVCSLREGIWVKERHICERAKGVSCVISSNWQRPGGNWGMGKAKQTQITSLGLLAASVPLTIPPNFHSLFEDHLLKDLFISLTLSFCHQLLQICQIVHYSSPSRSWVIYIPEETGSCTWISMMNQWNLVSKCPNRSTKLVLIDSLQTIWNIYIYLKNYTSGLCY